MTFLKPISGETSLSEQMLCVLQKYTDCVRNYIQAKTAFEKDEVIKDLQDLALKARLLCEDDKSVWFEKRFLVESANQISILEELIMRSNY